MVVGTQTQTSIKGMLANFFLDDDPLSYSFSTYESAEEKHVTFTDGTLANVMVLGMSSTYVMGTGASRRTPGRLDEHCCHRRWNGNYTIMWLQ